MNAFMFSLAMFLLGFTAAERMLRVMNAVGKKNGKSCYLCNHPLK